MNIKKPKLVGSWKEVCELALTIRNKLESDGMVRPSIRGVYYLIVDTDQLPDRKGDYSQLCKHLGKMRDDREIPMGLFSSDNAGESYDPLTDAETRQAIEQLKGSVRATIQNGTFHALLVEKAGLIDNLARWTDGKVPVASCQGQLRREFLYEKVQRFIEVCDMLGGKKVRILYLGDWDTYGHKIARKKIEWIDHFFKGKVQTEIFAVTPKQAKAINRTITQEIHLDGFIASYGIDRFSKELNDKLWS
jgi:hypothetical protein